MGSTDGLSNIEILDKESEEQVVSGDEQPVKKHKSSSEQKQEKKQKSVSEQKTAKKHKSTSEKKSADEKKKSTDGKKKSVDGKPVKKRKTTKDKNKRKKLLIGGVIAVAVVAVIVCVAIAKIKNKTSGFDFGSNMSGMNRTGAVTATGTTTTGMISEELKLSFLETSLEVEEVYVHQGDSVEAGTKIMKISEESLAAARSELERTALSAEYDYREQAITASESEIDAKATYDKAVAKKEYALQTYNDSLRDSYATITSLKSQIEELEESVAEYTAAINDSNYYYNYYNIAELKAQRDSNFEYLMQLYEEWDMSSYSSSTGGSSLSSTTSSFGGTTGSSLGSSAGSMLSGSSSGSMPSGSSLGSSSGSMSSGSSSGSMSSGSESSGMPSGTGDSSFSESSSFGSSSSFGESSMSGGGGDGKQTAYNLFDAEVTEESNEYLEAVENYEEKTKLAAANYQNATAELIQLKASLTEAELNYETTKIEAKQTYDSTVSECDKAQDTYETEMERINENLDTYLDAYEEAKENLEYFESKVGDGYFYASHSGDVMMLMSRAGRSLSGDSMVMAYTDSDSLSVEVSVDQADIASLTVGESAVVSISGYDSINGRIISINPITQSSSRSSVSYSVIVGLEGDVSELSENLTATVIFEMNETKEAPTNAEENNQ